MANLLVSVGGLAGGTGGKTAPATLNSYPAGPSVDAHPELGPAAHWNG